MNALALAFLLVASASAQLDENARLLRDGNWNERIHAATALGARGAPAVPLLCYAARDADWQVRMTAAHELGRVGRPALDALETVLKEEPCRHVRLTALHWLGIIGPEASDALRRSLSDESAMVRLTGKYWLDKQNDDTSAPARPTGKYWLDKKNDPEIAADGAAAAEEDLNACVASPVPGRAPWAAKSELPAFAEEPQLNEVVVTRDPVLTRSTESLPGAALLPARPAPPAGDAGYAKIERARMKELDEMLTPSTASAEAFPAPPSGFGERTKPGTSGADIVADAGAGKMAVDPLPVLLEYLKSPDAAMRARAADELGRRGAPEAVGPLTARLKDRVPRVRASAAIALGNIGAASDPAVPALVTALKKGPEEVAWSVALALGRIGSPRARRAFAKHSRESAGELVRSPRKPKP
ncbi:MAG: HEAT repeat domain-containing protein [Elusimicrobia bacterium]|nr:HEAT repeat domain-containing protein [Elusimicrobiota bacterium]